MSSPVLYVIGRPALVESEVKRFLADQATRWTTAESPSDSELLIELGGRLCYFSFGDAQSPKTTREYIAHLVEQGHESVLEHAAWTFVLTGVSRAFTHQFVRHRVGFSFSQLSQQYHDESDVAFVRPSLVASDSKTAAIWDDAVESMRRPIGNW